MQLTTPRNMHIRTIIKPSCSITCETDMTLAGSFKQPESIQSQSISHATKHFGFIYSNNVENSSKGLFLAYSNLR